MEDIKEPENEKQARINQLVTELKELVMNDSNAHDYLDDVMFEVFGYD